jgi:myosin heavy subunit
MATKQFWIPVGASSWVVVEKLRQGVSAGFVGGEGLVVCLRDDTGDSVTVPASVLLPRCAIPKGGVDDLVQLEHVNEPCCAENLKLRFRALEDAPAWPQTSAWEALQAKFAALEGEAGAELRASPKVHSRTADEKTVYTYCRDVCIAVNPFEDLGYMYTEETLRKYRGDPSATGSEPHIYRLAEAAFMGLAAGQPQTVVVTGAQGSGKTFSARKVLEFMVRSNHDAVASADHMMEAAAAFDAFCCAGTPSSTSSSCAATTMWLHFDRKSRVAGLRFAVSLLGTTRAALRSSPGTDVCNFHVFNYLLSGPPELCQSLGLDPASEYRLAGSRSDRQECDGDGDFSCHVRHTVCDRICTTDACCLQNMIRSLTAAGVTKNEQEVRQRGDSVSSDHLRSSLLPGRIIFVSWLC